MSSSFTSISECVCLGINVSFKNDQKSCQQYWYSLIYMLPMQLHSASILSKQTLRQLQSGRVAVCRHLRQWGELFGHAMLYAVHTRCCQARPHSSGELLGGNAVVLCSDPTQLPAPSDTANFFLLLIRGAQISTMWIRLAQLAACPH